MTSAATKPELLSQLNPEQKQAVTSADGPVLILAGAGSGKTRVIAHRIAYLIAQKNVPPYNILAVTFTNKAAEEMRSRVQRLLRDQKLSSAPLVSTFHSLCVRLLRQDIEKLKEGYTRTFTIYDQDDSLRLVKNCAKDMGLDDKRLGPRVIQSAISSAKNRGESVEAYAARTDYNDDRRASIARVYKLYEERLRANNALDFDDLLIKTVRLLRNVPEVREKYNNKFQYILVDEYQDTNMLQFALISLFTEKQQNICVVGDEDQSIYKWRGADITNILNFEKHFPAAQIVRLEQNYRSTQTILDVASAVVKHNTERKGKNLWTSNPRGDRVRYYQAFDAESEARFVAGQIQEHRNRDPEMRAAVLYRTNSQSRVFEEAMRRAGLHYNIVGGFSFYERMEVRDIIAYLKLALNPNDSIALQRVVNSPPRGIGRQTLDQLERRARETGLSLWEAIGQIAEHPADLSPRAVTALKGFQRIISSLGQMASPAGPATDSESPVSDIVKAAILNTGYENALKSENTDEADARLDNLQELVNAAVDYDDQGIEGLREFIDHSALVSDQDQYKRDAPVTLLTAHSAKGLEFPLVFIVGLEDGLFPHSRSATDAAELEEERRLCYVAITRAEKCLYVSHAIKRRVYGEELASEPSQFLNEMPLELIEDMSLGKSWLSFARGSETIEYDRGDYRKERKKYEGKTYDSAESIAEFFKQRSEKLGISAGRPPVSSASRGAKSGESSTQTDFLPGSYVRHAKYGKGLVLRREGVGDSLKLTISFPGHGQKKMVQKYANLEKA
ncbi:MAG TPA: UvrD-helicase domain-containing protein [Pyrinomonadaceae bacterium]|nr:UvrD-helicase domain-containing protein [Pyrinomonadaceae bacterium]